MNIERKRKDYEVGYGKPPVDTRFKPGNRANPKGRPKGSKSYKTLMAEELAEKITVTIGGKPARITKKGALVKRAVTDALATDDYRLFKDMGGFIDPPEENQKAPWRFTLKLEEDNPNDHEDFEK